MARILLLVAIIIAIYVLFFRKKRKKNDDDEALFEMVECSTCGVYISKNEAIKKNDKYFCSVKCLESPK